MPHLRFAFISDKPDDEQLELQKNIAYLKAGSIDTRGPRAFSAAALCCSLKADGRAHTRDIRFRRVSRRSIKRWMKRERRSGRGSSHRERSK